MRIGFISQWFEPEPGAAAHPTAVIRALAERGHEVTVLTGFPNYPHGRVYEGYRQRPRFSEVVDGMKVHRLPSYLSHDSSAARRSISLLSFGISATAQARALRSVDVVLVYASPITAAMPAMALKALDGIPYVLYVQDLWPDSVLASGFISQPKVARGVERILDSACEAVYRRAASIAVIAPGMKRILNSRGVPEQKLEVVYNWVDEATLRPSEPDPQLSVGLGRPGDFILMYAGGVGDLQSLDTAVRAVGLLGPDSAVHLAIVGQGVAVDGLKSLCGDLGVSDQVSFWPAQPLAAMPAVLASADAQLVPLKDLPVFEATIPSKVQATLACARPMIVSAPGDAGALAASAGAALTAPPDDPEALAEAIRTMQALSVDDRARMGAAGRSFYERELSRSVGAARLEQLLQRAVAEGHSR